VNSQRFFTALLPLYGGASNFFTVFPQTLAQFISRRLPEDFEPLFMWFLD